MNAARKHLTISPGTNARLKKLAWVTLRSVINVSPATPNKWITNIPPRKQAIKAAIWVSKFFLRILKLKETTTVPTIQPNKYPDEGAKKTEIPPRPPDNKGAPMRTSVRKIITDSSEFLIESSVPANITPKVWAVIGTPGKKGKSIFGIRPRTEIIATWLAICTWLK